MKLKNKNAISLIVLVITIIVLSILAATVIISLSNTNIISQASDAVKKTEAQQIEEAKALMYADGILGNNPEDITIGDTIISWDNVSNKVVYKQLYGNPIKENAPIPVGFYYVGGTKDSGLVISDNSADENKGLDYTCAGNQFVWVPVDDYSKFVRGTAVETSSGSGVYKMTGSLSSNYTEPYSTNAWEVDEYNAMCESVQKYAGFYIARFEAGDGDATAARTAETSAHTVVSKKGAYVYDYVTWGDSMTDIGTTGAVYLSQNMYKNHGSVASTLCYGVQWDAVLNFVSAPGYDITKYGGSDSSYNAESDILNNIHGLLGGVWEWTMETCASASTEKRVYRGGIYYYFWYSGMQTSGPAGREAWDPNSSSYHNDEYNVTVNNLGFRVSLYLK